MIQREVRVMTYDAAVERWGQDPQTWPAWECPNCSQRNSGWVLECGRCEAARCETISKAPTGATWNTATGEGSPFAV